MTYAILGTLISIILIGLLTFSFSYLNIIDGFKFKESMGFGSLISATDAVAIISAFKEINVDPNFFQILFGESCLNDAVSIVFYETTTKFDESIEISTAIFESFLNFGIILFGSIVVGFAIGFLTAWALKIMSTKSKQMEKIEIGCMSILPFVSYLVAEMLGLSGIVAILFNGIAHSAYTKPYLRSFSKIAIKGIYEMIAHMFETLAYIFLGLGFSSFKELFGLINIWMIVLLTIVVLIARAVNIIVCSYLCNLSRSTNKLEKKHQVSIIY